MFVWSWLGLPSPASSVIEGITVIGFLGFFVFMIGMASRCCSGSAVRPLPDLI